MKLSASLKSELQKAKADAQERTRQETVERRIKDEEKVAGEILAAIPIAARTAASKGLDHITIARGFRSSDYTGECTPPCPDSDFCFSRRLYPFNRERLTGAAKLVYDELTSADVGFRVELVDTSDKRQDSFTFKIYW